jgi:hypothetical protein
MITEHEAEAGSALDPDSIGSASALLSTSDPPSGPFTASIDATAGGGGDGDSSSTPEQFGSWPSGGGQGIGGSWPGGGGAGGGGIGGHRGSFEVLLAGLPAGDAEQSFRGPLLVLVPGEPIAPHPTPEPGTIALVGVNGMLLAAIAWKHRRYKEECPASR